jgi:hypothetical protein
MGVDRRGGKEGGGEGLKKKEKKRGAERDSRSYLSIFDKFDDAGKGEISVWAKLLANGPFLVGENT